jgi:hypothetical protein
VSAALRWIRAAALAAALAPAGLPAQGPGASPLPECAWTQGPCSSYRVELATREIWRGYSDRSGAIFLPSASIGLFGYPRTTLGQTGVSLDVRGRVPLDGDGGNDPGVSGAVLLHHRFSRAPESARVSVGVRGWAGDAPLPGVDGEVVGGIGFPAIATPLPEAAIGLRVDAARLFGDTEGTYGRVLLRQPIEYLKLPTGNVVGAIELGASASDLPARNGTSRSFGFNALELTLRAEWQLAEFGALPLTAGLDVGGVMPDDEVGATRGWGSIWIALQP